MWRLYFLVFASDARSEPARHAHESPRSMTVPLMILAVFAFAIGFIVGLPHIEGVSVPQVLAHWLEPSVTRDWYASGIPGEQEIEHHLGNGLLFGLMAIALVVGIAGIVGAWMFYGRGPSRTVNTLVERGGTFASLYQASKAKLWFDEFYDVVIVRPFKVLARGLFEFVDRFVVDTVAVNGSAFVVGIFGRVSRWFQNGNVQRYLVGVVIGGALVFVITDCRHKATFDYTIVGNQIKVRADTGGGILSSAAHIHWDLDGDGQPDHDPQHPDQLLDQREVTAPGYDGPITMWVEDPITRRETKVTRTINLNRTYWPPPEPEPTPSNPGSK
jgi:NADH-dehyrogenase subunit F-like protein